MPVRTILFGVCLFLSSPFAVSQPLAQPARSELERGYELAYPVDGEADYDAARVLLETAADAGNSDAQYLLGLMARDGLGALPDQRLARSFFQSAWQDGHSDAGLALADLLLFHFPEGAEAALPILERLQDDARVGANARLMLAEALYYGSAGEKDEERGISLARAVLEERPDLTAANYLAGIGAMEGIGGEADPPLARALWSAGVRGGDTRAMMALGHALRDGHGGPIDAIEAWAMYAVAHNQGHPDGHAARADLGVIFNREEHAEAQRRKQLLLESLGLLANG